MDSQDIYDTSQLCLEGSFNDQVASLLQHIRLARWEVENLIHLYNDLLKVLRRIWPKCQVTPFGSIVTGLGIKTSDVDIYVNTHSNEYPAVCVRRSRSLLMRYPDLFTELFGITTAKVPIVKLLHTSTDRYSDLNFSSNAGVRNSELIACLLQCETRALDLAILVKYWAKVHKLTGTNFMPNYALTLLVIFYLQQKKMLPSVCDLQNNIEMNIVDNWNTAFNITFLRGTDNTYTLYQLLGGFFQFYATFDFENNIISPFLGQAISKNDFSNFADVPMEFEMYRINVTNKMYKPLRLDTNICVQDPFEHCRNCTVMIHQRLYMRLLNYFKLAKNAYEEHNNNTFLRKILIDHFQRDMTENLPPKLRHNFNNKVMKNNHKPKVNKKRLEKMFMMWKNQRNKS